MVVERAIGNGKNGSATTDEDDNDDDATDDGDILDTDDGYTFAVRMASFVYWLLVDDILELSSACKVQQAHNDKYVYSDI